MNLSDNMAIKNIVVQSPQHFPVVQYPSTSFSQANATFNIIPPSPDIIIERHVRITVPLAITIDATLKPGKEPAYVFNTQCAGLCQYPLHQMLATLTITFNNQAVTIQPSQIIDKFLHYNFDRETQKSSMSTTPCYPDQANDYGVMDGSITSEFAPYDSSVDHISRHCNAIMEVSANPTHTESSIIN
jgi:hypothetical protein